MVRALILARRLARTLWVRVALFTMLALCAVLAAHLMAPIITMGLSDRFGPQAVLPVLTIIAASILAIFAFSQGSSGDALARGGSGRRPALQALHEALAILKGGLDAALALDAGRVLSCQPSSDAANPQ